MNRSLPTAAAGLMLVLLAVPWAAWQAAAGEDEPESEGKQTLEGSKELPWEATRKPPKLPGRKLQNAKEFLELLGVDASQWRHLFHDQPLGPGDEEWIDRILYHLPRIGGENTHRWRQTDWDYAEVVQSPAKYQGEILLLRGRAIKCERVPLVPELVDRYEFSHYFRVHLALKDQQTAIVCTRRVPLAWTKQEQLDERAEAHGIFLKTSPVEEGPPQFVCASLRVAWLPDRANEAEGITPAAVLLAEHGFDFGLWDQLKGRQKRGLDEADREPFYQLLGAAQTLDASQPLLRDAPPVSIAVAMKKPAQQTGKFVTVEGTVTQIDRVEVSDRDVQARYGLDHYFTLYVLVHLVNERIGIQRHAKDKNPRIFDSHFPVTVCVPQLPPGLQAGPNVHEEVRLHGVFFKVWTYKPRGGPENNDLAQPCPLIIAPQAVLVPDAIVADPTTSMWGGVLFVALLGALGLIVWRMNRSDARFKRDVLEKKILKEDQVDLSHLEE